MKVIDGNWLEGERADMPKVIARMLNEDLEGFDLAGLAVGPGETDKARIAQAVSTRLSTLGRLVDQWLESGKNVDGNGADSPWARNIEWTGKSYPMPLSVTLSNAIEGGIAQIRLLNEGRLMVSIHSLYYKYTDPLLRARELGIGDFVSFLDAPTRERLSRCDECKKYFVSTRTPRKNARIRYGTFCVNCKGKGGVRRTLGTRQRRNKRLVTLAAQFWTRWKPLARYGKRPVWVATRVNKRLRLDEQPVTGKWVTQNRLKIQVEVERGNNATRNS
jgi:hypothetical protein